MPHGAPDWSNVVKEKKLHRLDDMAELVARLGSLVLYDRRGDLVWCDSFEYGIQGWEIDPQGTGAAAEVSCEAFRSHGFSAKMTAGSTGYALVRITRYFPLIEPGRHGCEFSWTLHTDSRGIEMTPQCVDRGLYTKFGVFYSLEEKKLYYLDHNNTWVILDDTIDLSYLYALFHTWKLVFNTETGYYIRLLLDNRTYLMEDKRGYTESTTASDHYLVTLSHLGKVGKNPYSYFDDVIITMNEPL